MLVLSAISKKCENRLECSKSKIVTNLSTDLCSSTCIQRVFIECRQRTFLNYLCYEP